MNETVLCYIESDNKYLMLFRNKRKNDLNEGKYIGIGGHIEKGETKEEALLREVKEETGLALRTHVYRGKVIFNDDDYHEIMHLFYSNDYVGMIKECEEGTLSWIDKNELNNLPLWEGDKIFLDLMIREKNYFELELNYSKGKLISHKRNK